MDPNQAAGDGASAFYTLVLLTVALCYLVPKLLARLLDGKTRRAGGTLALLGACAGLGLLAARVRPRAQAWADAAAAFDPFEILGVADGANATVVKRAYRNLARAAHPDKGGDPAAFRRLAQAHAALAGTPRERRNFREFGHPDGARPSFAGLALPHGFETAVALGYLVIIAVVLVGFFRMVTNAGPKKPKLPKKETIVALVAVLQDDAARPASPSALLVLLGALLDEHDRPGLSPVSAIDAESLPARAAAALDNEHPAPDGSATTALTPTGALLLRRALGEQGRRLDESSREAVAEKRVLELATSLARAAVELQMKPWHPARPLEVAISAHQYVAAPEYVENPPPKAQLGPLELAVHEEGTKLLDICAGDQARLDIPLALPPADTDWWLLVTHGGGKWDGALSETVFLRAHPDGFRNKFLMRIFTPKDPGDDRALTVRLRAVDRRGIDSEPRTVTYALLAQAYDSDGGGEPPLVEDVVEDVPAEDAVEDTPAEEGTG